MKHTYGFQCSRRGCLMLLAGIPAFAFQAEPGDWSCPMDPDVHLSQPGKCPRCGMTLVLKIPDRLEYPLSLTMEPAAVRPGESVRLVLQVLDPSGNRAQRFEIVHEKLMHLFVVSEDLEFFAHVHPSAEPHGSFVLTIRLPKPGMYRLLADYYPSGSTPQLSLETLYVQGRGTSAHLIPSGGLQHATNLTASLRLEPEELITGLQARLYYTLEPSEGLERYLGAWGHMLIASEDSIDLMHLHPFLAGTSTIQYNVIFPRPGMYKVWSQFQRMGVVNTVVYSVKVKEI